MTEADTLEFATFLVREFDCRFTMDGGDSAELALLTRPDDVAAQLDLDGFPPRFFVTSPRWTGLPLYTHKTDHVDGRVRWYVEQRYGGPAFHFNVSRPRLQDGKLQIVPGSLTTYPWYYVQRKDPTTFDRPAEMARAFDAVRRYLARRAIRARRVGVQPPPWILRGALAAFEDGCWLRWGDYHFEPDGQLTSRLIWSVGIPARRRKAT